MHPAPLMLMTLMVSDSRYAIASLSRLGNLGSVWERSREALVPGIWTLLVLYGTIFYFRARGARPELLDRCCLTVRYAEDSDT
jgi:hypothetical protein